MAETINPRVEIDTSPPFESVKEAVDHFGGSGPWIPHHLLRLPPPPPPHHETEVVDVGKMEEQAVKFEKDLILKEQEALNVLREVEAAKRFVEGLKVNLMQQVPEFVSNLESQMPTHNEQSTGNLSLCPLQSPGHVLMELNQAKLDLNKMSIDLTVIRSSVETLNNKMKKEKVLLDRSSQRNPHNSATEENKANSLGSPDVDKELQQLSYEAEQFKKMAEASRYEVMKAMSEIERTKASIKIAEMRLHAAKKMEEAAKAVEAIAFAERKARLNGMNSSVVQHKPEGITIPYEEYYDLARKAQQAEELCKIKFVDTHTTRRTNDGKQSEVVVTKNMEETTKEIRHSRSSLEEALDIEDGTQRRTLIEQDGFYRERSEHSQLHYSGHKSGKFKFRNPQSSLTSHSNPQLVDDNEPDKVNINKPAPMFRSSISIGDILSRKLILRDDIVVGKHMESHTERQHVSFSQMLREQSGIILNPTKAMKEGNMQKQYISQKKKFGFIQVPLSKQNKRKTQPLNMR